MDVPSTSWIVSCEWSPEFDPFSFFCDSLSWNQCWVAMRCLHFGPFQNADEQQFEDPQTDPQWDNTSHPFTVRWLISNLLSRPNVFHLCLIGFPSYCPLKLRSPSCLCQIVCCFCQCSSLFEWFPACYLSFLPLRLSRLPPGLLYLGLCCWFPIFPFWLLCH